MLVFSGFPGECPRFFRMMQELSGLQNQVEKLRVENDRLRLAQAGPTSRGLFVSFVTSEHVASQSCHWSELRAPNVLVILYLGYLEPDVVAVVGACRVHAGLLVCADQGTASILGVHVRVSAVTHKPHCPFGLLSSVEVASLHPGSKEVRGGVECICNRHV